jgi:hypothetical protein
MMEALGIIPTLTWAHLVVVALARLASSLIIFHTVEMAEMD